MSIPIEHYAMIGDGETIALVNRDGGVDWLCWPRFDSDACFAALLGDADNGCWTISPSDPITRRDRRYQRDTLVMETDLHTEAGGVRLIDFMPMRDGLSSLVRIVVGLEGDVGLAMTLKPRFGCGLSRPWVERFDGGVVARMGPDLVALHAPIDLEVRDDGARAEFKVRAGQRVAFVLRHTGGDQPIPPTVEAEAVLVATQNFWRGWIARFDDSRTRWPEVARRSLITLKALIHHPSGSMVAAPTTSLPELPGGASNWDYRYCWLRDASFTVSCLVNAGFIEEAVRWRDWLLRAVGGDPAQLRIMYRVDGGGDLKETELAGLPGWEGSLPVRIGNLAATQHQVDVYGELLYAFDLCGRAGLPVTAHERAVTRAILEHLVEIWDTGGSGIWEARGQQRQYTYSKAMACVAMDNHLRQPAPEDDDAAFIERLSHARQDIRDCVMRDGWDEERGHFTGHFGGEALDASLLLMPLVGFLPADEPKMAATIEAIGRDLDDGGLIRRANRSADGPNEGVFLACSCWMADCLNLQGRRDEAIAQFERVLALRNDVGLFSEEFDVPTGRLTGNFPQALTHLAVVNTALALCGPVIDRGGG